MKRFTRKYDLFLEDLKCHDSLGNVTESYPDGLLVRRDVERDRQGNILLGRPYDNISYCSEQGFVLPSFALTCAIVERLFREKDKYPSAMKTLMQYKNKNDGDGMHIVNTIINWKERKIIHYPQDSDFPNNGGNSNINQGLRKERDFEVDGFGDMPLLEALKKPQFKQYLVNLTGLSQPDVLIEIGEFFGRSAYVWVPTNPERADYTSSAWFGCGDLHLNLIGYDYLDGSYAFRGVRLGVGEKKSRKIYLADRVISYSLSFIPAERRDEYSEGLTNILGRVN